MKKLVFFFPLFIGLSVFAQVKLLTMEDAMVRNRTTLAPENLRQLQFIYGTSDYAYLKKNNDGDVWVRGNFNTATDTVFLSLPGLNGRLKAAGFSELKSMPAIQFNKAIGWIMNAGGAKIAMDPKSGKIKELLPKDLATKENAEESAAGFIAYLDNHNLFVADDKGGKQQLTTDGSSDIVYASSVHRDEFGINKGIFWSSSGSRLAFYRMDQSMVTDYPIINWSSRPAKNENIKYPMAGDKSHHVTVGIYHTDLKKVVYLKTGEPADQYLTNIAWSPDEKFVYVAVLNRGQDMMKLNQYDAATGEYIKTLFEEKDDKYVEPLVPMLFLKNNPSRFIWQSNRDGWNHLYLYDINGNMFGQLTRGNWEVTEVKGLDDKGDNLFYVSTEESPISRNLYKLNLKTGKTKRVTTGFLMHNNQVNTTGTFVIDNYSSPEIPRNIQLIDIRSGKTKSLLQSANPLNEFALGKMSIFTIKNNSGTDLYCRLYKPVNFDSLKKYPVIVYWYGGPHAQMIQNGWNGGAGDYWFQYMAARGYLVFTLDPRGSDNRGKAFEQAIFRNAGDPQMEDLMTGVNHLGSLSYVDKSRMGLFGWSYGGFMTTDFLLNHPGVFKAGVAGGPVMNWQYYEIMYGERYMDTPKENPEGYDKTNLIRKAGNLKDKLLLIHGIQDPVVLQQNSVDFVKACVDKGVQVDYMIYPGHEHNVTGKDRVHLYQKVTDYFIQNL